MDVLEPDHADPADPAMQLEEIKLFRTKTREGSWSDVQQQRHSFTTRVANWALDDGAGVRLPVVQSEQADSISMQPAGIIVAVFIGSYVNDYLECDGAETPEIPTRESHKEIGRRMENAQHCLHGWLT